MTTATWQRDRLFATVHPDGGDGVTLINLRGTLSGNTAAKARTALLACLAQGPAGVIVDLADADAPDPGILSPVPHPPVPDALVPLVFCGGPGLLPDVAAARRYLRADRSAGTQRWTHLAPSPAAPSLAREFVARASLAWRRDTGRDRAELVMSELASNAVQHAGTELTLLVAEAGPRVHLGVRDGRREPPHGPVPPATPDAPSGRGLRLVASCTYAWGVATGPAGKLVWATLGT